MLIVMKEQMLELFCRLTVTLSRDGSRSPGVVPQARVRNRIDSLAVHPHPLRGSAAVLDHGINPALHRTLLFYSEVQNCL